MCCTVLGASRLMMFGLSFLQKYDYKTTVRNWPNQSLTALFGNLL